MKQLQISSGWIIFWNWSSERYKRVKPFIAVFSGKVSRDKVKFFIERFHLNNCGFNAYERFAYGKVIKADDKVSFSVNLTDHCMMQCGCDPYITAVYAKNIRLQKDKNGMGIIKYTTFPKYKSDVLYENIIERESQDFVLITNEYISGVDGW